MTEKILCANMALISQSQTATTFEKKTDHLFKLIVRTRNILVLIPFLLCFSAYDFQEKSVTITHWYCSDESLEALWLLSD